MATETKTSTPKSTSKIRLQRKLWYKILAPKLFGQKQMGETYLTSPQEGVGRVMSINLRDLTANLKDQNYQVRFRLMGVKDNALQTEVIGYEVVPSLVKRAVRKNSSRIDDTFRLVTKEREQVTLKSLIVTRSKVQRSVRVAIRRELRAIFEGELPKVAFQELLSDVITYKLQGTIKKRLNKLSPTKEVMIRSILLLDRKASSVVLNTTERPEASLASELATSEA